MIIDTHLHIVDWSAVRYPSCTEASFRVVPSWWAFLAISADRS